MYFGTNFSGAEFGVSTDGAFSKTATQVWFPQGHYDYFKSKGFNAIRLPIAWDLIQPNVGYGLAAPYQAKVVAAVESATKIGMSVILDVHNYARKNGALIGSSSVTNAHFADLWSRLATLFKDNDKVLFGIMNEPHDMQTSQWVQAANVAIAAIRKTGATQKILVPGNYWSGTTSWTNNEMGAIQDPNNNWFIDVHCYLNSNGSGATEDVVSATILRDRLAALVAWCKAQKKTFLLTEFSTGPSDPKARAAIEDGIRFLKENQDVCQGFYWWANIGAAPPNDKWTPYAINPSLDYKTEDGKVAWLTPFFQTDTSPPQQTNIRKTSNQPLKAPSDQGMTAWLKTPGDAQVKSGSYPIAVLTRTTYSDQSQFVVAITVQNPSDEVDIDWRQMRLDLRGHTISSSWDCNVLTAADGSVVVTPAATTKTVKANSRTGFGLVIKRSSLQGQQAYQILVKSVDF